MDIVSLSLEKDIIIVSSSSGSLHHANSYTVQLPNNNRNLYKLRKKKTDLLESGHLSSTWYQYQEIRLTFSEYFRVWFIFTPINHVWGNCVIASMVFHGRDFYSGFWVKICGFLINILVHVSLFGIWIPILSFHDYISDVFPTKAKRGTQKGFWAE